MNWQARMVVGAFALAGFAGTARADDTTVHGDLAALEQRLAAQERKIKELEGTSFTQDEMTASVDRYLRVAPTNVLVGGGGDGSAGFPLGKKPFIKEGPNKLEIAFRNQVRYSAFLYSKDAIGTSTAAGNPLNGGAPVDRMGFENERMYIGFDGSVFCEEITFKLELNFDSDSAAGVEKNYMWLDWKYTGEHHIRAGSDKVAYCMEENTSSSSLAFVDRCIVTKAFEQSFTNGVALWGYLGDACDCPKRFMYKVQVGNGEGRENKSGSVFNTDAFGTFSDNLEYAGMFEWNITCNEWKWDEVDHRPCDKRCDLNASLGIAATYEKDDDLKHDGYGGLALRSSGRIDRTNYDAWFRAQWNGWSLEVEWMQREIDYVKTTANLPSTAATQTDSGAQATLHYRFAETNWGVGVRYGIIWLDSDYKSLTTGPAAGLQTVAIKDQITEYGFVVNYFFYDHNNKISADVNWVSDNSGVSTSSAGYLQGASKGVLVEDGVYLRLQWQISF